MVCCLHAAATLIRAVLQKSAAITPATLTTAAACSASQLRRLTKRWQAPPARVGSHMTRHLSALPGEGLFPASMAKERGTAQELAALKTPTSTAKGASTKTGSLFCLAATPAEGRHCGSIQRGRCHCRQVRSDAQGDTWQLPWTGPAQNPNSSADVAGCADDFGSWCGMLHGQLWAQQNCSAGVAGCTACSGCGLKRAADAGETGDNPIQSR